MSSVKISAKRLPQHFFTGNRTAFMEALPVGSLALLCSGRPPHRTADEDYTHFGNRNFFYLTGIEQEKSILVLIKTAQESRQILFAASPDAMQERWNGRRLTRDQVGNQSGISEILYLEGFSTILADLIKRLPIHSWWVDESATDGQSEAIREHLQNRLQDLQPDAEYSDLAPLLTKLRMVKSVEEQDLIRQAASLTGEGILSMLRTLRPGLSEYHLWSEFQYTLSQAGCLELAFPSIVAAGQNIFCLHHMQPFGEIKAGDVVQVDVGAIVGGLCADISRVFPADGKFTEKQLAIYQLVRRCQDTAFAFIQPGVHLSQINEQCRLTAAAGLREYGILSGDNPVGEYFWHSVSHHLGMDVHDVCERDAELQPGMVLTVEPGLYVPEWQVGMRIEDDVVVTAAGCDLLSAAIPREAHEIEALMLG